ncbi:hypothetical protein [Flagellimonas flava]|uniref:Uncharacterized protein n=1 Tax=Flagellimonas flava TaxID=570519 RepID=A0A1M5HSW6_9FLAO|nr:hypothetical protein [Allomuricauda flava]SHG19074.1 hypothetical protein SAMN04488116_0178 [Allomuricauda flava]
MRKFCFPILFAVLLTACSDGDLQVDTIDFDSTTLQFCDDPVATSANILFKINTTEALILELPSGVLDNGVVGETITTTSTVPGQSKLTYRIFSDDVSSNYFCDDIPPISPNVVQEIEAQDGIVSIETVSDADGTNFVHTIRLTEISFVAENGERITNLAVEEFGEVNTVISN